MSPAQFAAGNNDLWFLMYNKDTIVDAFRESQMRRYLAYDTVAQPMLDQITLVRAGFCHPSA